MYVTAIKLYRFVHQYNKFNQYLNNKNLFDLFRNRLRELRVCEIRLNSTLRTWREFLQLGLVPELACHGRRPTAQGQPATGQHQRRGLATPTTKRHLPQGLPVVVGINRCIVSLPVKVARSTGAICQNDSGKVNLFLDRDCIATIQMTTYI